MVALVAEQLLPACGTGWLRSPTRYIHMHEVRQLGIVRHRYMNMHKDERTPLEISVPT